VNHHVRPLPAGPPDIPTVIGPLRSCVRLGLEPSSGMPRMNTTRRLQGLPRRARPALASIALAAQLSLAPQVMAQNFSSEAGFSPAATQIRASSAYALGATGRGVTVAVLDTGLNLGHREFAGRVAGGLNTTGTGSSVADGHGHGTHVAGLIGAARDGLGMMGIAYGATLLPVKVLRDDGTGNTSMMAAALRGIGTRAQVVNMSLGGTAAGDPSALRTAVGQGLLIVAAAGNRGAANPDWPARFARETWANGQIIAVGAVDSRNQIASFSNRAGDTAPWFVVAPGVSLVSTYLGTSYASMSGTSMATPVVSGAAALVKSRWQYLRADQVANVLFVTATDLGAPGIDAVYGRGLVNIDAAMKPVGHISTALWNGRSVRVLDSGAVPTPAVGGLWGLAVGGQLKTIGMDELGRDFGVDLGERVARPQALSFDQVFARMDRRLQMAERVLADGSRWAAAYDLPAARGPEALRGGRPAAPFANDRSERERLLAFSFDVQDAQGRAWSVGLGLADRWFGLQGTAPGRSLQGLPALANPYFGLVPSASHVGAALPLLGGQIKAGVLSSALRPVLLDSQGAKAEPKGGARAAVLEYARNLGDAAVSVGWTGAQERGSVLGSRSGGALSLGDSARTDALNIGAAWAPAPGWALGAQAARGRTPGHEGADSLIRSLSAQRTESWSLALLRADTWQAGDRLSLALSQPLRTTAGTLQFDAADAVDADGQLMRGARTLSMVPGGRERLLEISYGRGYKLAGMPGWLDATLALRRHGGHLQDAPAEAAAMLRWQATF